MTAVLVAVPPEPEGDDGLVFARVDPALLPALARFAKTSGVPTYLRGPAERTLQAQPGTTP